MNQGQLAKTLSKTFFLPRRESTRLLRFLFDQTAQALQRGERAAIRRFGAFRKKTRAAKKVRHPKTGQILTVPEHVTVDFEPSPLLQKRIQ